MSENQIVDKLMYFALYKEELKRNFFSKAIYRKAHESRLDNYSSQIGNGVYDLDSAKLQIQEDFKDYLADNHGVNRYREIGVNFKKKNIELSNSDAEFKVSYIVNSENEHKLKFHKANIFYRDKHGKRRLNLSTIKFD